MRERSVSYEDERSKMMNALKSMKEKICSIEKQYAGELMNKLRLLRIDIAQSIDKQLANNQSSQSMDEMLWQSVDQIA